jgi:hypothetical protein
MSMRTLFIFLSLSVFVVSCKDQKENTDPSELILQSFEENDKFGYKDTAGNVVIPARFDFAYEFDTNAIAGVHDSTGWIMINKKGETVIIPFEFDNGPDYYEEGLARFVENGKMGFFNGKGEKVIPAKFDFAMPFLNGRAVVCNGCQQTTLDAEHWGIDGGSWGAIDRSGNTALPFEYNMIIPYDPDSLTLRKGEQWMVMDWKTKSFRNIDPPKSVKGHPQ